MSLSPWHYSSCSPAAEAVNPGTTHGDYALTVKRLLAEEGVTMIDEMIDQYPTTIAREVLIEMGRPS